MKIFLIVAIAVAVLGMYAVSAKKSFAQQNGGQKPAASGTSKSELSTATGFYCNRKALTPEQTRHKEELGKSLRDQQRSVRELPDGFAFELPFNPATFQSAAEWVSMERACCPFFEFDLRLESEQGTFWLSLKGKEGVKPFIRADLGPWLEKVRETVRTAGRDLKNAPAFISQHSSWQAPVWLNCVAG